MDEHVQTHRTKLIIFDLDDTLIDGSVCDKLFVDTLKVLGFLKDRGCKMIIASHNHDADWYLRKNNISHFFDEIKVCSSDNKVPEVEATIKEQKVRKEETLFVDDLEEIVTDVRKAGVPSLLVNYEIGVTLVQIQKILM